MEFYVHLNHIAVFKMENLKISNNLNLLCVLNFILKLSRLLFMKYCINLNITIFITFCVTSVNELFFYDKDNIIVHI